MRFCDIKILMVTVMAAVMAACANDSEPQVPAQVKPILFGSAGADITLDWANGRPGRGTSPSSKTRGEASPDTRGEATTISRDASTDIPSIIPDNLGVFALGDGPNTTYIFRNQKVYRQDGAEFNDQFEWKYDPDNTWPYTTEAGTSVQRPWEEMNYRFFAYSPWSETKNVRVTAENYSGFNSFIWDNIPGFTANDYVLANEIQNLDNTAGTFTTYGNVVVFSMRHILSRLRFFFRSSVGYHQIRRIKINSITVLSAGNYKSATFNFKNDAWDETVHWSNETAGDADPVTLTSESGLEYLVGTDYGEDPFCSVYVYPQAGFKEIKMKVDYSVYDSEDLLTRTASVTNIVTLPDDGWNLESGYYYNIYITIAPSYLYILSDNDQDFDGFVIIDDDKTP